ncbi:hypothetical protein [Streptomyces xanthii]|nr:hypothetical protein [Streptomyces xanthii]
MSASRNDPPRHVRNDTLPGHDPLAPHDIDHGGPTMRAYANRTSRKLYVLGVAAAAALALSACGPGDSEGSADGPTSASPTTAQSTPPSTPDSPSAPASSPVPSSPDPTISGGPGDAGNGGWDLADRQTPPAGSVCDHDGQGPYGAIESVSAGGESPTMLGLVLGSYRCDADGPTFTPSSATGAATDVLTDDTHLKVVVGGQLAQDLGTKTPDANTFVKHLMDLQDKNALGGPKAPQFYFRTDVPSDDINAMPDDNSHLIYLFQITDGD